MFDPKVIPFGKLMDMATRGGAAALNMEDQIGTVELGKRADLILMDMEQAHISPTHDLLSTIVISAGWVSDRHQGFQENRRKYVEIYYLPNCDWFLGLYIDSGGSGFVSIKPQNLCTKNI